MDLTKEIDKIRKQLEKSEEEYISRALIAEENIKYGRLTDINDLEKESEEW